MKTILTIPFVTCITLIILSSSLNADENTSDTEIIQQAEKLRLKAKTLGFEWTTTSVLIKAANEALKEGDKENAMRLAKRAIKEANAAIQQAEFARNHWRDSAL